MEHLIVIIPNAPEVVIGRGLPISPASGNAFQADVRLHIHENHHIGRPRKHAKILVHELHIVRGQIPVVLEDLGKHIATGVR
jgi:hypothetical protein